MSTVTAVVNRGDAVLMIAGPGTGSDGQQWLLPGGKVEPGETLHEALCREVLEETGLRVDRVRHLAWVGQTTITDPEPGEHISFVFAVDDPGGTPIPNDPDGKVVVAEFVAIDDAIERLRALPWPRMRDPAIAYLEGRTTSGTTWTYRISNGSDQFVSAVPAPDAEG